MIDTREPDARSAAGLAARNRMLLPLLLAILLVTELPPITGVAAAAGSSFNVSLSATPSATDPLLVSFSATVVPGNPTGFNWSFGDARYWNGTGPALASPVHRYSSPGLYNASVIVFEGTNSASQWVLLRLPVVALTVTIRTQNATGTAPLTVEFDATVSGGTGTYRTFLWNFGDGGRGTGTMIRYTYLTPGRFVASVNVSDSSGSSAIQSVPISVAGSNSGGLWGAVSSIATWAVIGGGSGAVVSAIVLLLVLRRRERSPDSSSGGIPDGAARSFEEASTRVRPVVETPSPVATPSFASIPESPPPLPAAKSQPEILRLSQRVVLHLARQGRWSGEEVAPPEATQAGMSNALDVRQNRLTNVLRRLHAAGVIGEEVRHVKGRPRRLKVYSLTPRGEALARDLRTRSTGRDPRPRPTPEPPRPSEAAGQIAGKVETPRLFFRGD